jgi:hypothetical protein
VFINVGRKEEMGVSISTGGSAFKSSLIGSNSDSEKGKLNMSEAESVRDESSLILRTDPLKADEYVSIKF